MGQISETFDFGSAICMNGGILWDLHNQKVLEEWRIAPRELHETVTRLRNAIPAKGTIAD